MSQKAMNQKTSRTLTVVRKDLDNLEKSLGLINERVKAIESRIHASLPKGVEIQTQASDGSLVLMKGGVIAGFVDGKCTDTPLSRLNSLYFLARNAHNN